MTLDELKRNFAIKRDALIAYRDGIEGDGLVAAHARAIAEGRLSQLEMDIRLLNLVKSELV